MQYIDLLNSKRVIVDDEDFELLKKYSWRFMGRYVVRHQLKGEYTDVKKRKIIAIHTQIMRPSKGFQVDHINHNPLDNRKANLRLATQQQNIWNRRKWKMDGYSKYKGVSFYKKAGKWVSSIKFNGRSIYLGTYDNEISAARAYKKKARELFQEFAYA